MGRGSSSDLAWIPDGSRASPHSGMTNLKRSGNSSLRSKLREIKPGVIELIDATVPSRV